MHFVWLGSASIRVFKFLQIKERGPKFWGEPVLQNVWIIWSPLVHLNLKSPMDPNSSSFIRFHSVLQEWGGLFSESWNFYKVKKGDLISGGNQFCRMSELFDPPFCISILKLFWNKTLRVSLDFNVFCMIKEYFSQGFQMCTNSRRGIYFLGWTNFAECLNYLVPPSVFQF